MIMGFFNPEVLGSQGNVGYDYGLLAFWVAFPSTSRAMKPQLREVTKSHEPPSRSCISEIYLEVPGSYFWGLDKVRGDM